MTFFYFTDVSDPGRSEAEPNITKSGKAKQVLDKIELKMSFTAHFRIRFQPQSWQACISELRYGKVFQYLGLRQLE